jgi:hypothetical protein
MLLARFPAQFSRSAAENPEGTVTSAAHFISARMAELADALRSGRSSRKGVEVRVLFRAPISIGSEKSFVVRQGNPTIAVLLVRKSAGASASLLA